MYDDGIIDLNLVFPIDQISWISYASNLVAYEKWIVFFIQQNEM